MTEDPLLWIVGTEAKRLVNDAGSDALQTIAATEQGRVHPAPVYPTLYAGGLLRLAGITDQRQGAEAVALCPVEIRDHLDLRRKWLRIVRRFDFERSNVETLKSISLDPGQCRLDHLVPIMIQGLG